MQRGVLLSAGTLPHLHKLVVAGNHDLIFDREFYESPEGHQRYATALAVC
jgi:hypothetical protein